MTPNQPDRLERIEDLLQKLSTDVQHLQQDSSLIKTKLEKLDAIEKQLTTLDNRFFEFSMRVISANQSAFYSVGLALLSAAIAFVVAKVSSGGNF